MGNLSHNFEIRELNISEIELVSGGDTLAEIAKKSGDNLVYAGAIVTGVGVAADAGIITLPEGLALNATGAIMAGVGSAIVLTAEAAAAAVTAEPSVIVDTNSQSAVYDHGTDTTYIFDSENNLTGTVQGDFYGLGTPDVYSDYAYVTDPYDS